MPNFFYVKVAGCMKNSPDLWVKKLLVPENDIHKYERGVAAIYGAPSLTGATRLAASACARMGAGLVNVLCATDTADIYRISLPAHILVRDLSWNDPRISVRLYGCGGLAKGVQIRLDRPAVIDADALFAIPEILNDKAIITPHEGEFCRMFPALKGARIERAQEAALLTGAIVVLKGAQTLIAHPDGRVIENDHATPYLASAGTGDVLAGMIAGLLAQDVPAFEAACAAVWVHGDCAIRFGLGLVASDLIDLIPVSIKEVLGKSI
jgi:hydroxyethylthiazole kinase-like uncharacterized protein yjeF